MEKTVSIVSNLRSIDSLPQKDRKIDAQIENAIDDKNYTFENPLVIQDPFDRAPLTAVAVFSTKKKVGIRLTVKGERDTDNLVHEFPASKRHRIPILGLYAGRANDVLLEQIEKGKVAGQKHLSINTEPLPSSLQNAVQVTGSKGNTVEGLTVISGLQSPIPYAFDSSGNVRWYMKVKTESHGYFPMSNGRFMLMNTDVMTATMKRPYSTHLYDMDFLGRVHNIYLIPNGVHHDVTEKMPDGNLFVISNSLEEHVEDLIIELDRKTGNVVKQMNLGDVIKDTYNKAYDWAHINTVSYNQEDGSILVSPRNISSAIKIDWASGNIKWILADPAIWKGTGYENYVLKPIGPTIWHYEQHAVYKIKDDLDKNSNTVDVVLFDNRNIGNSPIKLSGRMDLGKSYVTQYAIDEKSNSVKQVKVFPNKFAFITSNYNLFFNLDRLIAYHGSVTSKDKQWGEVYEYEYSTGKLACSYKTKNSFYRGYRQEFGYSQESQPMEDDENPVKGALTPLKKLETIPEKPAVELDFKPNMWISEDILYINAPNLSVGRVELVGNISAWETYMISDDTKNVSQEKMKNGFSPGNTVRHNIAIPISGIPKDKYSINLDYFGVDVSTGAEIEIK